jgi:hypothetical protein
MIGFFASVYLAINKAIDPAFSLTNRPAFYIGLTVMVIGIQLFLTGFIAELVSRNSSERNTYLIEEKLGL